MPKATTRAGAAPRRTRPAAPARRVWSQGRTVAPWALRKIDKRWRLVAVLALSGPGALALTPAGAEAGDPSPAYVAMASASGARLTWAVPGEFAVEEITDAAGPIAQSRLDAGSGESFASLPYPGGTAVAYQGLLSVTTGLSSPFEYPFHVQAVSPGQPEKEMADPSGTYRLHAKAQAGSTTAVARFRPGNPEAVISGGEATTSIATEGLKVTSAAESVSETVSLAGGALRMGSVRSRSVTTYTDGADAPETETSLVVDGLAAGATRFGVGPEGFVVLGQPVPYSPKDAQAVLDQVLLPAGLSLRFVKAEPLTGGARAAALEVVTNQAHPPLPATNITLRLGGASSAVTVGEGSLPVPVGDVAGDSDFTAAPPGDSWPAAPHPEGEAPSPASAAALPDGAPPAEPAAASAFVAGDGASGGFAAAGSFTPPAVPAVGSMPGPRPDSTPTPGSAARDSGGDVAVEPIVRPREVRATRLLYGLVGGAAALMLLLGGAVTRRGGVAAWLDA